MKFQDDLFVYVYVVMKNISYLHFSALLDILRYFFTEFKLETLYLTSTYLKIETKSLDLISSLKISSTMILASANIQKIENKIEFYSNFFINV